MACAPAVQLQPQLPRLLLHLSSCCKRLLQLLLALRQLLCHAGQLILLPCKWRTCKHKLLYRGLRAQLLRWHAHNISCSTSCAAARCELLLALLLLRELLPKLLRLLQQRCLVFLQGLHQLLLRCQLLQVETQQLQAAGSEKKPQPSTTHRH